MEAAAQTSTKAKARQDQQGEGQKRHKNGESSARDAYYERLSKHDMAPLWVVLKDIIPGRAQVGLRAGDLAFQGRETDRDGSRRA